MEHLHAFFAVLTANPVGRFVMMIAPIGLIMAVLRLLFFRRKIQPNGFRWKAIGTELVFAAINTSLTGFFLGGLTALLNKYHLIQFNHEPARWWTILLEYACYFILMGFYVHSGYEFLPRWWNKTWLSKWFITATFHDQHHKYFRWNFGGYTTVWDRICGTMRPKYEADFDQIKARVSRDALQPASITVVAILVVAFTVMATLWSMGLVLSML